MNTLLGASILLTADEVAERLGVTRTTLSNMGKTERLLPIPETRGRGRTSLYLEEDVLTVQAQISQWKAERVANHEIHDGFKPCNKCKERLPVERFSRCKQTRSGLSSWCKKCTGETSGAWHKRNRVRRQEQKRAWYKKHPEVRAAEKRRYHERHRDRIVAYVRQWYRANHDYVLAYGRARNAAKRAGSRAHLLSFLVELTDRKACQACHRLKPLFQFEKDSRTRDGYTKACLTCLPPRKSAPGGLISLDKPLGDGPGSASLGDLVSGPSENPEERALAGELWDFVGSLPASDQAFLLCYMETLDLALASSECQIDPCEAERILARIQKTATAAFDEVAA